MHFSTSVDLQGLNFFIIKSYLEKNNLIIIDWKNIYNLVHYQNILKERRQYINTVSSVKV